MRRSIATIIVTAAISSAASWGAAAQPAKPTPRPAPHWVHYLVEGKVLPAQETEIETWIRETCAPDSMNSISGFVSQGAGGGGAYNLYIFCRTGTGKAGRLDFEHTSWLGPEPFKEYLTKKPGVVVLGFVDDPGPADSAFVIFPVRKP